MAGAREEAAKILGRADGDRIKRYCVAVAQLLRATH
jgi:hypothetical protein